MYKPKNSFYTLLLGIVVFTLSNNSGRAAGHPTLTVSSDSIVDASAMNFSTGRWGTSLNGQAFQQDGVVTYNGYQYAAYFDANKRPAVGRRALPSGAWETFSFNDYGPITHTDAHNVIVVGICPEDGSIHLSYDHHVDDLNYRRSVANVATNPSQVQWTQALFGSNSSQLVSGSTLDRVTYPMFFTTPEGKLQFTFRDGSSGAGDWYLYEYTSGAWQNLGMLFSRSGNFQGGADRCAYPNTMRYDSSGRLHVSWTWRETTDLITNHDLGYAYSDDRGRTWKNNDGTTIATLDGSSGSSNAISINSIGHVVYPMPINWGIMNQTTQFIDSQGRVHIIYWRNPDSASSGTSDVNEWQYYHYWREVSGVWHERELPFTGRKPQVVLDQDDNMYIIHGSGPDLEYHDFDPGVTLTIASATEASGWTDWVLTPQFQATTFHGEPLIDLGRWDSDDILSVYFQEKPSTAGNSSALHVIDFVPSTLPDPMGGSVVPYTSEADTLALYHFDESSGALVNSQGNTSLNLSDTGGASGRDGNSANGSGYGLSSFPGFDSAFNVLDSGDGGYHSSSSSVGGGAITAGNVAQSALQGASGEFTYEAVIKLGNISSSDEQVIISHDGAESSRGFLLKVNNGQLGFYDGSSTTWAAIPTSGAHSFVTDEWFHVAVTYTGAAGQSDNLKLYWTRLDSSATEAHLIGTGVLAADLSGAVSNKLGVGTTTRNPFRFEIDAIDEVRISRVARSADDFIFVELPDPPAAPSVPTNLTASDGDASASLSWTGSAGASTYNVKRSLNNGGSYSVIASNVVGSSYTDSGLTNGTTYYYVVSAENAAGESTNSSEVSATPQSSTSGSSITIEAESAEGQSLFSPFAVSGGMIRVPNGTGFVNGSSVTTEVGSAIYTFTLSEAANITIENHVDFPSGTNDSFWYKMDSGSYTQQNGSTASMIPVTFTGLSAGTHSYQIVRREDGAGFDRFVLSASVGTISTGTPTAPTAPSTPTALSISGGDASASLSWTGAAGASTYKVKRSLSSGGSYSVIDDEVVGTSFSDSGLTNGTTYYYVVSAENAAGESTNSSEVSATPQSSTSGNSITIEAESAEGQSQFSPFAVSGGMIRVPNGTGFVNGSSVTTEEGSATYSFTLSEAANVTIENHVDFPSGTDDSFWYKMDSGSYTQQNGSTASMIPVTFTGLSAGTHSYQIVRREDGAGFDRFVFSTSSGTITADTASQNVSTSIQANGNVVVGDDYAGYGDQDGQNGSYTDVQLNNENTGATLQGNSWKTFPLSYEVTPTTVLEVTINAPNVGEILGIALDNDSVPMNSRRSFLLGGSDATDPLHESWSWLVNPLYVEATGEDTFVIAVGQLFTGTVNYIGLIAADDATSAANVSFTDIKLYEDTGSSGGNTTAFIDFTTVTQSAYSGSQDAAGSVTILDNGLSLELTGNRWRVIDLPYTITSNTLIDFDITIANEGELIGIGLDDDNSIHTAPSSIFKVAGADASPSNWFDFTTDYYAYEGGTDHIVIPVGKYYTGGSSYLAFVGDDDVGSAADVIFSNVRLYEGVLIDFDDFVLSSYSDQDGFNGHPTTTSVSQGGLTLNLQGNVWKKIPLNYTVTEHTIIECEVTVNPGDTSEVIAIGFEDDDVLSNDLRLFQLSGTQNWTDGIQLGNQPFTGEKFITIAVGEFYTGQMNALVLAGDDDANGTSNVTFKNIKIFETP